MEHIRSITTAAVLIGAMAGSAQAASARAGEMSAHISDLEARLTSASFAEREGATLRLIEDATVSAEDLLQLCIESSSPEVRRRALAIHRNRFFSAPRPAIGVTFPRGGILPMIERLHDPFPAANEGSLQIGDIIIAVGDIRLSATPSRAVAELRPLIFSHDPFESVRLTVYRPQNPEAQARFIAEAGVVNGIPNAEITLTECPEGYDTIETEVQLGEWQMLGTNTPMSDADRTHAWNALLQRRNFSSEVNTVVRDSSAPRNVTFHGKPPIQALDIRFPFLARGAFFPPDENPAGFRNQAVIAKQFHNMAIQRVQVRPPGMADGAPDRAVEVESIRTAGPSAEIVEAEDLAATAREIASTRARILELSELASEPGTSAADRRAAEQTIQELRETLKALRDRLTASAS